MIRTEKELENARREAEAEIGFAVNDEVAEEILSICKRKLKVIGKGDDYLPILYRCELPMKIHGMFINSIYERTREYVF